MCKALQYLEMVNVSKKSAAGFARNLLHAYLTV